MSRKVSLLIYLNDDDELYNIKILIMIYLAIYVSTIVIRVGQ